MRSHYLSFCEGICAHIQCKAWEHIDEAHQLEANEHLFYSPAHSFPPPPLSFFFSFSHSFALSLACSKSLSFPLSHTLVLMFRFTSQKGNYSMWKMWWWNHLLNFNNDPKQFEPMNHRKIEVQSRSTLYRHKYNIFNEKKTMTRTAHIILEYILTWANFHFLNK